MNFLIPKTNLSSLIFTVSVLNVIIFAPAWTSNWKQVQQAHINEDEYLVPSEPVIVFHCIDWIKDTLPSYDLDFVLNNPSTIGNPGSVASPKVTPDDPQFIPNAKWIDKNGAGACNYEPVNLDQDSVSNLGYVYARAIGGDSTCQTTLFWRDRVEYYSCENMLQNGGIYARIFRRWAAICGGARKDTVQVISFARPTIKDFVFNINGEEIGHEGFDRVVTYQACSGDKSLIKKEDVTPYVYSYFSRDAIPRLAYMDGINGRYGIQIQDKDFPTCGSRGVKIDRTIYVLDSCQGIYIDTFRVLIKIGDYQGPKFIKTQELPEIHINSSDGKAVFGLNRSEFASRFGIQIEECFLGGMSAWVEVLIGENVWEKVPSAATTNGISVPVGHYRLQLFAVDICFNASQDSFEFVVKNELGPIPICINGLSIESLLSNGQGGGTFTLKASDFVAAPIYDQNGQGPDTLEGKKLITHYSINRMGQVVDSSQKELKISCFDANKLIILELHAWDKNGHNGFCTTFVEVLNRNMVCFDEFGFSIAGQVSTEGNVGVQNVTMDLFGPHHSANTKTTKTGIYALVNLKRDEGYRLTPKLDENPLNGVSTFDILLIQKHILNIQALNSPYKMIAADVNNSKSISTLDIIQLRKLILGIDTKFTNNRSWRFINAGYIFPSPILNPWLDRFPESISIASWITGQSTDFVAVKIGDVNASAKVNISE